MWTTSFNLGAAHMPYSLHRFHTSQRHWSLTKQPCPHPQSRCGQ